MVAGLSFTISSMSFFFCILLRLYHRYILHETTTSSRLTFATVPFSPRIPFHFLAPHHGDHMLRYSYAPGTRVRRHSGFFKLLEFCCKGKTAFMHQVVACARPVEVPLSMPCWDGMHSACQLMEKHVLISLYHFRRSAGRYRVCKLAANDRARCIELDKQQLGSKKIYVPCDALTAPYQHLLGPSPPGCQCIGLIEQVDNEVIRI